MLITNTFELREAIRHPYAWPGGYPTYLVMSDGDALCIDCARTEYRALSESLRHHLNDGWRPEAQEINYEDWQLQCDNCGCDIEHAYPPTPADDDYVIQDSRNGYLVAQIENEFGSIGEACAAIRESMERDQFWPDVWYVNERGNTDLLVLEGSPIETDAEAYRIVRSWV